MMAFRFRDLSIRTQVMLVVMLTSIPVAIAISSVSIVFSSRYMRQSLRTDLMSMAGMTGDNCLVSVTYRLPKDAAKTLQTLKRRPSIVEAVITLPDGSVFASYGEFCDEDLKAWLAEVESVPGCVVRSGVMHVCKPIMLDGNQIGTVHLFDDMGMVRKSTRNTGLTLLVILLTISGAFVLLLIQMQRLIAAPIIHLSQTASDISRSGDYSLRAEAETGGEIGILVESFNRMLSKVESAQVSLESLVAELEDKNMELERFTYTVSHELKSPLITINGFLGQLRKHLERGEQERVERDMQRIETAADKMHDLLNDLLELSRIGRIVGESREVPFNEVVDDAVSRLEMNIEESGVKLVVEPEMPVVKVDTRRFPEVLQNLIENAIKFTADSDDPEIRVGCREEDGRRIFFVADNGRGIEQEYRERVFGLFEQLNTGKQGTGIGLAIVKRIIETHAGEIWIEDGINGRGVAFCFTVSENNKEDTHNG